MNLKITDEINEKDEKTILEGLLKFNLERIEDKNPKKELQRNGDVSTHS